LRTRGLGPAGPASDGRAREPLRRGGQNASTRQQPHAMPPRHPLTQC
jgi:hypothetical protein